MTMNTRISSILFFVLTVISLHAEDTTVIGKVKNTQGLFTLVREKNNEKTTLAVVLNQQTPPVWTKTWSDFPDGGSLLDYWQIIDGCTQGNDVAFLLGMHRGLLWVKATRSNGVWAVDFAQENLRSCTSRETMTAKITLNGTDSVVVTNDKGIATTFTRSDSGAVLKDGGSVQEHATV